MNEIAKVLEKVAEKLGMTASELFPHIVRKTYILGCLGMFFNAVLFVIMLVAVALFFKSKCPAGCECYSCRHNEWNSQKGIAFAVSILLFVIIAVSLSFSLPALLEPTGMTAENLLRVVSHTKN